MSCGIADDRRLGHLGVGDQRRFDLRRPQAVARHIDDVVDAAGDPVVAVGIAPAAVAGEVLALVGREIGLDEAVVVAVDRAHLARPGIDDAQIAAGRALESLPSPSTSAGLTPKNGRVAEPGLSFVAPGRGVMRMPPVSVCHQVSTIGQRSSPTTVSTTPRPRD